MRLALQLCLMILVLVFALPATAADMIERDGVLHVLNGSAPSEGMETWSLTELWRAGGEDDEVFFGSIELVLLERAE